MIIFNYGLSVIEETLFPSLMCSRKNEEYTSSELQARRRKNIFFNDVYSNFVLKLNQHSFAAKVSFW